MNSFRDILPNVSVTPKLHLLEHHIVPFIKKWKYGFGVYGEQGIESIHQNFNKLFTTYCRMKPSIRRLKAMMDAHMISVNPEAKQLKPPKRKRFQPEE